MNTTRTAPVHSLDVNSIRRDFPILQRQVNGRPLVYLDNGATSQKPKQVIDAIVNYYTNQNSNIHRGVHTLSQEVTQAYESARTYIHKHIHSIHPHEVIFTCGTTDSINLVAFSFGKKFINPGDKIMITHMEHHSNILPWQKVCEEKNAELVLVPVLDNGELDLDFLRKNLSSKIKLLALAHVSNTLGTINPVKDIISLAHEQDIPVLLDGAQAIPHLKVDVQELDCDFFCFSGHKVYGPTGIGVLYGKEKWLNRFPEYRVGGGTINSVSFEKTKYAGLPLRFEAGTPHIEGGIVLAKALEYINGIGLEAIERHERQLLEHATRKLLEIPGMRIIGTSVHKAGVLSFIVDGTHPFDVGTILDKLGIAVRTGHHCTQPLMQRFGIPGTIRASFSLYNTLEEADALAEGVKKAVQMLK